MAMPPHDPCRSLIAVMNESGPLSLSAAAAAMHLHPRKLERQLQAQGLRFEALRDAQRRRLARQLLLDPRLEVADVALRLGYRDSSNFSRTCRRWFGATPSALRLGRAAWPADEGEARWP